jgi:uncharacterized membrane protein
MMEGGEKMARIEKSIVINAPPEKVFAKIGDFEGMLEWNDVMKEVKITSKKRKGVGVTYHEVAMPGGTRTESDAEVTGWIENERIDIRSTAGNLTFFGSTILKPVTGGTELTIVANYEVPYSILGKIIDKLKVSKDIEKNIESANQNLKNLLES